MRKSQFLAVLAAAVLAGGLAAACGGGGSGASPSSTQGSIAGGNTTGTSDPAADVLFLVGHPIATGAAVPLLRGFETRINAAPGPDDVVLFTVTATDGPMVQTREQIEALRGKDFGPAAILLVKTDEQTDQELQQLVIMETRDILERNQIPDAASLPVIVGEDPNLPLLLRGLR